MPYTLDQFNRASPAEAEQMLDGLYEHTPWIAAQAVKARPFHSLAQIKQAMASILDKAGVDAQLALIRAHPELAGKAMSAGTLTTESTGEQARAGLTACTPEELQHIRQLNHDYGARFGFPFVLCVRELHRAGRRLPYHFEVVGFAEEEGQRYKATFLGSGALVGDFKSEWLEQQDADGVTMRQAMQNAGLAIDDIATLRRNPSDYLGFIEVHIEQGPVLNELNLPLGVVTSINASVRYVGETIGQASHAGTTPMNRRRDAACAAAELALYAEQRAAKDGDSVATMGMLAVPSGSINVVPGRCGFSLDLRAPSNAQRDAMAQDIVTEAHAIAERRGVMLKLDETMRAAAAPSDAAWQQRWEAAVQSLGLPVFRLPSGAGHDAMKLHEVMPQAMLFVRGENAGISHNPLEQTSAEDMELAVRAMQHLLDAVAVEKLQ